MSKGLWAIGIVAFWSVNVGRADVLLLNSTARGSWAYEVANTLSATGKISGNIDVFRIDGGTPTLSELDNYSAVMVFADLPHFDGPALGDLLADYVDQGHGVVDAVFSNASSPPLGRFASGGYAPILPLGQTENTRLTLGAFDASSPLMAGVHSFDGGSGSFVSIGTLAPGAVGVASWGDGSPLIATLHDHKGTVVALNFYPPSSISRGDLWDINTDGGLIMAIALNYAAIPSAVPLPKPIWGGMVLCGLLAGMRIVQPKIEAGQL